MSIVKGREKIMERAKGRRDRQTGGGEKGEEGERGRESERGG